MSCWGNSAHLPVNHCQTRGLHFFDYGSPGWDTRHFPTVPLDSVPPALATTRLARMCFSNTHV